MVYQIIILYSFIFCASYFDSCNAFFSLYYRNETIERGRSHFAEDGLNSLKYHIKTVELKETFTRILVQLIPEEVIL